jgi:hypothetical protein
MELDDFKLAYQTHFEQVPDKSGADLDGMLQQRSHTAIERIMRNLLWEVGASLVILVVLSLIMATWSSTIFRWVGAGLVLISLIQVVLFTGQYRQLKARLNQATGSVHHHLREMVAIISRFVRIYYRYCLSSIPLGALLGGYIGATADTSDPAFAALPEKPTMVFTVLSLVLAVAAVIGTYFMLKWYIHRLYGRYLNELNQCLIDLGEVSS